MQRGRRVPCPPTRDGRQVDHAPMHTKENCTIGRHRDKGRALPALPTYGGPQVNHALGEMCSKRKETEALAPPTYDGPQVDHALGEFV